jgi:AAA15 family ATPase/GTPase
MIHSFTCENFYSIGDEIEVDFSVGDNAPTKATYVDAANGSRVSLVESVIGPNASGKTTVLKILAFMQWLIVDAYADDPDRPLPVRPFGHKKVTKPTLVSVAFSIEDRLFNYDFKLTRDRILSEKFTERSRTSERVTTKLLFSREWDDSAEEYSVQDKVFGVTQERLRKNSSAVATAFRDKNPLATLVAQYWRDGVFTNVAERGYRNYPRGMHDHLANHAIEFFYDNPELKDQVELLLSKYDLGFGAFKKHEVQEKTFFGIEHQFDGGRFELPLEYESSGTKQVIIILRYVLSALASGGIAVIDELDANLHPEIVEELIAMFTSKDLNPLLAQIIFSSHTPTILSTLDKYQITFVEKNDLGQSEVWRLDSIRGVRTDDNYYTKYIAGAYGAMPDIG